MSITRRRARIWLRATLTCTVLAGVGIVAGTAQAAEDTPRIVAERWLSLRMVDLTVHSPANGRDLPVRVLVPSGWTRDAARTWPVLYLLHGQRDDYTSWTRETDIQPWSAGAQVLVVMPEAGRDGYYSDWWNYGRPGGPRWETFHLEEVWQVLQQSFRAGSARSVAGISSGGLGAVFYAARHPGMFRYAAAYSAPLNVFDAAVQVIITLVVATESGDPLKLWGLSFLQREIWSQHDPITLAPKLRGTGIYLSSGTTGNRGELDLPGSGDLAGQFQEALIGSTVRQLTLRLAALGIPATVHLYGDGTHSWPYWQRELHTSWPLLMASLGVS